MPEPKRLLRSQRATRIQTQVLYGARVVILDELDDWFSIAVPDQATPKSDVGYLGWAPKNRVQCR